LCISKKQIFDKTNLRAKKKASDFLRFLRNTSSNFSVLQWNNETINIWSHLLGFLYFAWLQYHAIFEVLPRFDAHFSDYLTINLCIFGVQLCMLLSVSYHIFGAANISQRRVLLRFDMFGISAGLISIYLIGIYTAFICFQEWQTNYFILIGILSAFTASLPLKENIIDSKLNGACCIGYLHIWYTSVAIFSIVPAVHWIMLNGGLHTDAVMKLLPRLFILYILAMLAFVFYASMIPERFSPGKFDVIGCSHQWWHLLILTAMIYWMNSGLEVLTYYRMFPEACHMEIMQSFNYTTLWCLHL
uniref:Progestin and adipoQ receptor family member 3 n=1 Tax=Dracunculus medinensis TaxID=318479 RepID=A0A0N4U3N2_DRAME